MRARLVQVVLVVAVVAYAWATFPSWIGPALITLMGLATFAY